MAQVQGEGMGKAGSGHLPDRFQDVRFLGAGACGQVYQAQDRDLGRVVAVKFLSDAVAQNPDVLARFRREAKIQALVEHPNVVRIFDASLEEAAPYLVMEFIQGEELDARLRRAGRMDRPAVLRIAQELSSALDRLHQAGVVHRDLKPANVMIRELDGSAVLMDLGLASLTKETVLTRTGQVLGTPLYMAPEVLLGQPGVPASDQYQLALILGECVVGARLIEGRDLGELARNVMKGNRTPWPQDLLPSDPLIVALERGLSVPSAGRFSSCQDLARSMAGELVPASQPSPEGKPVLGPRARAQVGKTGGADHSQAVSVLSCTIPETRTPLRLVVGLLGLVLLGWFLGDAGTGTPDEVSYRMVGDCLRVEFLPRGAQDIRLETSFESGKPVELRQEEETLPHGRRRLLLRGMPAQEEILVQLKWLGGAGPKWVTRAESPAVQLPPDLASNRQLVFEVLRPVSLGFETLEQVPPGRVALTPPALPQREWNLHWIEEGVDFPLSIGRREILQSAADQFILLLESEDPDAIQRERVTGYQVHRRIGQADPSAPVRNQLGVMREWLPEVLDVVDPQIARRLWQLWQSWERSALQARAMEDPVEPLSLPPRGIGGRSWDPESPSVRPEEVMVPRPQGGGGGGTDPGFLRVVNPMGRFLDTGKKYQMAADSILFDWPEHPRGEGVLMGLSIWMPDFDRFTQIHVVEQAAKDLPCDFWIWPSEPTVQGGHSETAWATVRFPARLAPPTGTSMEVTLRSFLTQRPLITKVGEIRVFRVR